VEAYGVELFEQGICNIRDDDIVEGNSSLPAHIYPRRRIDDETAQRTIRVVCLCIGSTSVLCDKSSACLVPVAIPPAQRIFTPDKFLARHYSSDPPLTAGLPITEPSCSAFELASLTMSFDLINRAVWKTITRQALKVFSTNEKCTKRRSPRLISVESRWSQRRTFEYTCTPDNSRRISFGFGEQLLAISCFAWTQRGPNARVGP
jgi:hypothetical protein